MGARDVVGAGGRESVGARLPSAAGVFSSPRPLVPSFPQTPLLLKEGPGVVKQAIMQGLGVVKQANLSICLHG